MSTRELVPKNPDSLSKNRLEGAFPTVLARVGKAACFAADEFFRARLSNPHTRTAYAHQVSRVLTWCEDQGLELRQVTPGLAGRFLEELPYKAPTNNWALAALRHFFDILVARHAVLLNLRFGQCPFCWCTCGTYYCTRKDRNRFDRRPWRCCVERGTSI
ncbi:MAG: site-specific integrase [Acidobacteriota bacterium]|nr:site-specific integrase [Acidobacteriota bacterium]